MVIGGTGLAELLLVGRLFAKGGPDLGPFLH